MFNVKAFTDFKNSIALLVIVRQVKHLLRSLSRYPEAIYWQVKIIHLLTGYYILFMHIVFTCEHMFCIMYSATDIRTLIPVADALQHYKEDTKHA